MSVTENLAGSCNGDLPKKCFRLFRKQLAEVPRIPLVFSLTDAITPSAPDLLPISEWVATGRSHPSHQVVRKVPPSSTRIAGVQPSPPAIALTSCTSQAPVAVVSAVAALLLYDGRATSFFRSLKGTVAPTGITEMERCLFLRFINSVALCSRFRDPGASRCTEGADPCNPIPPRRLSPPHIYVP
jgi:hypothetical protein